MSTLSGFLILLAASVVTLTTNPSFASENVRSLIQNDGTGSFTLTEGDAHSTAGSLFVSLRRGEVKKVLTPDGMRIEGRAFTAEVKKVDGVAVYSFTINIEKGRSSAEIRASRRRGREVLYITGDAAVELYGILAPNLEPTVGGYWGWVGQNQDEREIHAALFF